jgi:hypothetical protein
LLITGIKHVFFLIGATMTPVAILIAGWNHERAMWNSNGYAVITWREDANARLLPTSKQQSGFQVRKSVSVSGPGLPPGKNAIACCLACGPGSRPG